MRIAWNKGKIEWKKCLGCDVLVRKWRKYCSKKCQVGHLSPPVILEKNCVLCNKIFQVRLSQKTQICCSDICGKKMAGKTRSGVNHPMYGKHHKIEARNRISISHKGKISPLRGIKSKFTSTHFRKMGILGALKQSRSKQPTSIEVKLYQELQKRGYLFEKQKLINGKFLVDAYIPMLNLIIEADGDYWHSLNRVMKKDKAENAYLTKCQFNLLRLSETEINTTNFGERIQGVII